jgi:hypothetical protein
MPLKRSKDLQYKGDIQNYIVRIEALNYQVCLFGIACREALHSGLNNAIKDQPSFGNFHQTMMQNTKCSFDKSATLMKDTCKRKINTIIMITQDRKNKWNRDDDGDKGSHSNKTGTEKKGPNPVTTDQGVALENELRIDCRKLEYSVKSVSTAVLWSMNGYSERTTSQSRPTETRIRCLKRKFQFWMQPVLRRSISRNWLTKLRNQQQPLAFEFFMRLTLMVW